MSDSFWPHGLQHIRLPFPSPIPRAYSNSCPSSRWCHLTISSSIVPFSSCLQTFPASESFLMSQFFESGGQSFGASASVFPMIIQDWFPLELTGLILPFKGLSRVFSDSTVWKHQFFCPQLSLWSKSHTHTWLLTLFDQYTSFKILVFKNRSFLVKRKKSKVCAYSTDQEQKPNSN